MDRADEYLPSVVPAERPGQEGGKRHANRLRRTRQICEAALDLFLERGVEGATIDDVVGGAGLAKGTFYRYFESKEALVEALFRPTADAVVAALDRCNAALIGARTQADLFAAYQVMAVELAGALLSDPGVARLYLQECRGPDTGARRPVRVLARAIQARVEGLTRTAQQHGLLEPVSPKVIALVVSGAVEQLLFHALSGDAIGEPTEVIQVLIGLVLHGVADVA